MLLLDDALALAKGQAASRLWRRCEQMLICRDLQQLEAILAQCDAASRAGKHLVLALSYELGSHWQNSQAGVTTAQLAKHLADHAEQAFPYLVAWIVAAPEILDEAGLQAFMGNYLHDFLRHPQSSAVNKYLAPALVAGPVHSNYADYALALHAIAAHLQAGDAYQINYTLRQDYFWQGHPLAIYRALRQAQAAPFGACLALDDQWIVSCSPELLLRREGRQLTAEPMKGTARASGDARHDVRLAQALQADGKNRSENVMIVDLLRNDLSKIADLGSVRVPELFKVERFGPVLQMSSKVQAQCDAALPWWQVLRHLLPCGSVTGAPKHRAMQIIRALEPRPRGLYCGALGWVAPQGDFCFSVPIRTLQMRAPGSGSRVATSALALPAPVGVAQMSVGSGIVLESELASEWQELETKRRFAKLVLPNTLGLIETMRVQWQADEAAWRIALLDAHLARICRSASELGWCHNAAHMHSYLQTQAQRYLAQLAPPHADNASTYGSLRRLRLTWHADFTAEPDAPDSNESFGKLAWQLSEYRAPIAPVSLCWASDLGAQPIDRLHPLIAHKTTWRSGYDALLQLAQSRGYWDAIACNQRGELCEGTRSNILLDMGERNARGEVVWLTPPLACGLLPGVMRALLLQGQLPGQQARAALLRPGDLAQARALAVCNALHGIVAASLPSRTTD